MPGNTLRDLEQAHSALERFIQEHFSRQKERFHYGDWFEPLYFDLCEYTGRKGKRIRPLMLMLSYRAFQGDRALTDPSLLRCATALELLHTFVLMHDDVIDRSEKRRGLPTFHKLCAGRLAISEDRDRIGENIAMVMGDIVYAMAIQTLHESDFPPAIKDRVMSEFLQYTVDTGSGEILDILLGCQDVARVKQEQIEEMYHLKTTRYTFEAPCLMGALLAGATAEKLEGLKAITTPLGLAFQIQNDLIEYKAMNPLEPQGSCDLLEGKKTLLLKEAFLALDDVERSFLQMCLSSMAKRESALLKIQELVDKSGAVQLLEQRCGQLFAKSESMIDTGIFSAVEAESLHGLLATVRQQVRQVA
ncbi:MAG: polyprenyl synthetase family protein [Blastochloris sp.]|nr:polyprenyl synthetase family protein [Blastochloris sp.]